MPQPDVPFVTPIQELAPDGVDALRLFDLERLDEDLFRSTALFAERYPLFGGQVFAQALLAAARTTDGGSAANSATGYFLRPGDATKPILFRVDRDRDGRTYSSRRVVAVQDGEVILNLAASFQRPRDGIDLTFAAMPDVELPDQLRSARPPRLVSMEQRVPTQPSTVVQFPRRAWMRCTDALPDEPRLHEALIAYVSDIYSGFGSEPSAADVLGSTISHALWFHRPARADDWFLLELNPQSIAAGRGLYTGQIWDVEGRCIATLAQESLYVPRRPRS